MIWWSLPNVGLSRTSYLQFQATFQLRPRKHITGQIPILLSIFSSSQYTLTPPHPSSFFFFFSNPLPKSSLCLVRIYLISAIFYLFQTSIRLPVQLEHTSLWNSMSAGHSSGFLQQSLDSASTMPQDENAPFEDPSASHVAVRKTVAPLTTSKLINQSSNQVSFPDNWNPRLTRECSDQISSVQARGL